MAGIGWIEDVPAAIASVDREEATSESGLCGYSPVVLCATTEHIAVALCHVHVIKHRDGQSLAAIRPGVAGVFAYIQSPVVRVVNSAFRFRRHHQPMMIGVRIN